LLSSLLKTIYRRQRLYAIYLFSGPLESKRSVYKNVHFELMKCFSSLEFFHKTCYMFLAKIYVLTTAHPNKSYQCKKSPAFPNLHFSHHFSPGIFVQVLNNIILRNFLEINNYFARRMAVLLFFFDFLWAVNLPLRWEVGREWRNNNVMCFAT